MSIELKVGQKWQDAEGTVRNIKNVSGGRVTYSLHTAQDDNGRIMGSGGIEDFRDDILIADDGAVTLTASEVAVLRVLLAGFHVGPEGRKVLDKLGVV